MGMFDYINFEMPCPKCATPIATFQSKDGECGLSVIEPDSVNYFYSYCHQCGTEVSFSREPVKQPRRATRLTLEEVTALGFVMSRILGKVNPDAKKCSDFNRPISTI